jgi:CMP-N-acetylneuraminic acid synthetase
MTHPTRDSVIVAIPARGGSRGLPGKNLALVGGVSLVGRAVVTARAFVRTLENPSLVVVDTDSEAIAAEGRRWGAEVPFLRPAELALDTTPTIDNILHLVDRLRGSFDAGVVVLMQPTSPLRAVSDLRACWSAYADGDGGSVVSIVAVGHPTALAMQRNSAGVLGWSGQAPTSMRRQDHPQRWWPNGAVYVTDVAVLRSTRRFVIADRTVGVPMPSSRSLDIDAAEDLAAANTMALAARPIPIPGKGGQGPRTVIAGFLTGPVTQGQATVEATVEHILRAPAPECVVRLGPFRDAAMSKAALRQILPLRTLLGVPTVWSVANAAPWDALAAIDLGVSAVEIQAGGSHVIADAIHALAYARSLKGEDPE